VRFIKPLILVIFATLIPVYCFAQSTPLVQQKDISEGIRQQEDLLLRLQNKDFLQNQERNLTKIQKAASASIEISLEDQESTANSSNTPSLNFYIKKINLEGSLAPLQLQLNICKKTFENQLVSYAQLKLLVRQLTNIYVQAGYITTRIYIPKQNLKSQELTLKVQEGYLESIEFSGTPIQKLLAFPGLEKSVLNLRDLEQGIEQLNRLGSNHVTMKLVPSDTFGYTKVKLENTLVPFNNVNIRYDSYSSPFTSYTPSSIQFTKDSFLSINDLWNLNVAQQHNDQKQFTQTLSLDVSIPFGYTTTSLSYSQMDYLTLVNGLQRNFNSSGKTQTTGINFDVNLGRGANYRYGFQTGIKIKDTQSYIEDIRNDSASKKLVLADIGGQFTYYLSGGFIFTSIDMIYGTPMFGATLTPPTEQVDAPKAQFQKATLNLSYSQNAILIQPVNYKLSISGQISRQTLYSSEKFAIGDYYSVRGFSQDVLQGDSGLSIRQELSGSLSDWIPFAGQWITKSFTGFAAVDAGAVYQTAGYNVYKERAQDWLLGSGIGVKYRNENIDLDFSFIKSLKASQGIPITPGRWVTGLTIHFL